MIIVPEPDPWAENAQLESASEIKTLGNSGITTTGTEDSDIYPFCHHLNSKTSKLFQTLSLML